jgi:tRNA threonylcarbamoyladenosine biosynthesis protein TsaE
MKKEVLCKDVPALDEAARQLVSAYPEARVFAFYGNMGAGKTTFIKAICKVLGVEANVTSPTFSIVNEYPVVGQDSVFHFDFYRIKKPEEAMDIGYEDYFFSGSYCLLEWPELIEELLPENFVYVSIKLSGKGQERIVAF